MLSRATGRGLRLIRNRADRRMRQFSPSAYGVPIYDGDRKRPATAAGRPEMPVRSLRRTGPAQSNGTRNATGAGTLRTNGSSADSEETGGWARTGVPISMSDT